MNRLICILALCGSVLAVVPPALEASSESSPADSIRIDTLPAGMADSIHHVLYQEQPLVRPIHHP